MLWNITTYPDAKQQINLNIHQLCQLDKILVDNNKFRVIK